MHRNEERKKKSQKQKITTTLQSQLVSEFSRWYSCRANCHAAVLSLVAALSRPVLSCSAHYVCLAERCSCSKGVCENLRLSFFFLRGMELLFMGSSHRRDGYDFFSFLFFLLKKKKCTIRIRILTCYVVPERSNCTTMAACSAGRSNTIHKTKTKIILLRIARAIVY